jgi:hypothetical protein
MNTEATTFPRAAFALGAALALAALCLLIPAPGEAKPPKLSDAFYKVKIEGTQKTDWTYNHEKQGECDSNAAGGGSETIKFASRNFKVRAYFGLTDPVTFLGGNGSSAYNNQIPLRAKINRQGKIDRWGEVGENCPSGDGTGAIAPDCGTRTDTGKVELDYDYGQKDLLVLGNVEGAADELYKNCPNGGYDWPYLLTADRKGDPIGQTIEPDEMKKAGKYILLANGSYVVTEGDMQSETNLEWSVSFKRIGKLNTSG